jgi:hypothetical protein
MVPLSTGQVPVQSKVSPASTCPFPLLSAYNLTSAMPVASFPLPEQVSWSPCRKQVEGQGLLTRTWQTGRWTVPGGQLNPEGLFAPADAPHVTGVGVMVGVEVKVEVGVGVHVRVGVAVNKVPVQVAVGDHVLVGVGVKVGVQVRVGVKLAVGVACDIVKIPPFNGGPVKDRGWPLPSQPVKSSSFTTPHWKVPEAVGEKSHTTNK